MKRNKPLLRKTPLARGNSQLKRTPLRRVSKTRASELRRYSEQRKRFLAEHPVCEVWLAENGWRWRTYNAELGALYERTYAPYYLVDSNAVYFLRHKGAPAATEVHHRAKRRRAMLLNESFWLAVSRENHERIENHKSWAREKGFLLNF